MFGEIVESKILESSEKDSSEVPVQMALYLDIRKMIDLLYGGKCSLKNSDTQIKPRRVKFWIDDGGCFVKYALSIIGPPSNLLPSSVLNTCIIALHSKGE